MEANPNQRGIGTAKSQPGGRNSKTERQMIVVFRRSGERRYSVEAQRPGVPDVVMHPAPGYDPLIPHDLMHMVVEAQLGLTHAIYGQLAAGGTAGTFHRSVTNSEGSRATARASKRVATRGKKLLKESRDECVQSERATYVCWQEWLSRSSSAEKRKQSASMAQQAKEVRHTASDKELRALNPSKLDEICKRLDELSNRWSGLKVGESMAVRWPDLAIAD
jgi:hypothetical protein